MVLFMVLGGVVLVAAMVMGFLFVLLAKEGNKDEKAVPITDVAKLKRELASDPLAMPGMRSGLNSKTSPVSEVIPPFVPKVSMPTQPVVSPVEDIYKKRAQELEEELRTISQKAEGQSNEARQMIETLTKENESLKGQKADLEQAQQRLAGLQSEAESLRTDNAALQTNLDSASTKARLLEEEMVVVKMQMGEEIRQAKATVTELTLEKETLISSAQKDPDEALHKELDELKAQQVELKRNYEDLESSSRRAQELNVHLSEKVDSLQYELIKARAQSSGLERIGFNYKNQLEDFFKKINAVQLTNEELAQAKNRLEGQVEEIKSQNEALVTKDRLTQFELEKHRSQLVSLEREYENFKARTQHKDSL